MMKNKKTNLNLRSILMTLLFIFILFFSCYSVLGALDNGLNSHFDFNSANNTNQIDDRNNSFLYQHGVIANQTGILNGSRGAFSNTQYFDNTSIQGYIFNATLNFSSIVWFKNITAITVVDGIAMYGDDSAGYWVMFLFSNTASNISFYVYKSGGTPSGIASQSIPNQAWNMVYVSYFTNGSVELCMNNNTDSGCAWNYYNKEANIGYSKKLTIGTNSAHSQSFDSGYIDEMSIWNRSLSDTERNLLYNGGVPLAYVNYSTAGSNGTSPISTSYNVSRTQDPSDINSSLIGYVNFNVSITNLTTNNSINNSSYAEFIYNISTQLNNGCAIFENQICVDNGSYHIINMTKINNTFFNVSLKENSIFPAYYPFTESFIESNTQQYNYSVYKDHYIKFDIYNFTTYINPYITAEFDANNLTVTDTLNIFYCNKSYSSGEPISNTNCQLITVFSPQNFSHSHSFTKHYVVPVTNINITVTQNSSIVFGSSAVNALSGWNFVYILNSSYNNRSFEIGKASTGYTQNVNNIFDIHLHQFLQNDSIRYYIKFYDGASNSNVSSTYIDYFDIANLPPSAPFIYNPNCTIKRTVSYSQNSTLFFNWSQSSDINNDTFNYNVTITDLIYSYNIGYFNQTTLTYNYSFNENLIPAGNYFTKINVCDNFGCQYSFSSCTFNLCVNNYVRSTQPCISNTKLIAYYDANYCDSYLDSLPADNGTYETCTTEQNVNVKIQTDYIIIFFLMLLIVICELLGAFKHEIFFGMCALLFIFLASTFIYYTYPAIVYIGCFFMALVNVGMWILIKRN